MKLDLKLLKMTTKPVKLWVHTNLKAFFEMLYYHKISMSEFGDNLILSKNELSKNELAMISSDELQRQLRGASNSILFATKRVSGIDYLQKFKM